MTETVKAPEPTEAPEATKSTREAKSTPDKVSKAFSDAPTWAHVLFTEWASDNGIENIDDLPAVQIVAATTRLYNVFRAEPDFKARREEMRAESAATRSVKAEKPLSDMTPEDAAKELEKIQAAQKAAQERAEKQAARAAQIQAMLAEAGLAAPTNADTDEVDDDQVVDEDAAAAF